MCKVSSPSSGKKIVISNQNFQVFVYDDLNEIYLETLFWRIFWIPAVKD